MKSACMMLAAAGVASAADHTQPWLYTETTTVTGRGPTNWHTLTGNEKCGSGRMQSPVNIASAQADATLRQLEFSYSSTKSYSVVNNQHGEEVKFATSPGSFVDPALGNKKWNAVQFHVHSPSENGIGGGLYDMELHIVHTPDETQVGSTTEFGYAVVAIMFEASSSSPNEFLGKFFDKLQPLPMTHTTHYGNPDQTYAYNTVDGTVDIDISDLLTTTDYYTFEGSLTTPPCTEGVKWYVLSVPNTMSASQLTFHNAQMGLGELKTLTEAGRVIPDPAPVYGNNRPIQPLNGRIVRKYEQSTELITDRYAVATDDDDEVEDIAIAALVIACVSFLILIIYIITSCCCKDAPQEKDDSSSSSSASCNKPDKEEK